MKTATGSGKLFVISAPSGCGKTTLCGKLLDDSLELGRSVSVTTRPLRPGEKNGADYNFISERVFREMIGKRLFLEHERNFGYYYGTPRAPIEKNIKAGRHSLLSIDVKGAMKVKRAYPEESILIFILPPSLAVLKRRLRSRRSEDHKAISGRLSIARKELAYKDKYDYTVVNNRLDKAYKILKEIITGEINRNSSNRRTGILRTQQKGGTCRTCR